MPTTLTTNAPEEGSFTITASFTDEDGNAVAPNSGLKWHLTDGAGTVINGKNDQAISPASSVDITLEGDDLAIQDGEERPIHRILTIEGTYNSSYGSNLPLTDQVHFYIDPLVKIPSA